MNGPTLVSVTDDETSLGVQAPTIDSALRELDHAERMLILRDDVEAAQQVDFLKLARDVWRLAETKKLHTVGKKERRQILETAARYILVMGRELLAIEARRCEQDAKRERVKAATEARLREQALTAGAPASEVCATCHKLVGTLAIVREGQVYCAEHASVV